MLSNGGPVYELWQLEILHVNYICAAIVTAFEFSTNTTVFYFDNVFYHLMAILFTVIVSIFRLCM